MTSQTGPKRRAVPAWAHAVILLTIVLLAAALRLENLRQPLIDSFSWRQASTAMMSDNFYQRSWNVLYPEVSWTGPGPSYQGREFQIVSYIAAILHAAFGWHDWFGRLVAAVFGTWGVLAMHRLVNRIWDVAHAHAAALVLALLPGAIFIDRSFLPDPGMLSLAITGVWMLVAFLQDGRKAYLVLATLAVMFALLAKLPAAVIVGPCAYLTFVILRGEGAADRRRRLGLVLGGAALMAVPIVAYYRWAVYLGTTYPPYHVAGQEWLWTDGIRKFIDNRFYFGAVRWHFTAWLWTWPVLALVALGLIAPPKREELDNPRATGRWTFHAWAFGCLVFFVVAAGELRNNSWNYHVFNGFAAALGGRGLVLLATLGAPRWRLVTPVLRVAAVALVALSVGHQATQMKKREHAREAYHMGRKLDELAAPQDLVIAVAPDVGDPIGIYYSRRRGWVFPPGGGDDPWNIFGEDDETAVTKFEAMREQGARWLGIARSAKDDGKPEQRLFLEHHKNLLAHVESIGGEKVADEPMYVIYRVPPP